MRGLRHEFRRDAGPGQRQRARRPAHWELGDKAKALEVEREAIAALSAQIAATPAGAPGEQVQQSKTMLTELQTTLEKYEREQPPAPPVAGPAPEPQRAPITDP